MSYEQILGAPGPMPSSGGLVPGGKGHFQIPTGVQRLYQFDLFSTYKYAAGTISGLAESNFFGYTSSQAGGGFTTVSVSETNVVTANMAPGGETYEVNAIAAEIMGAGSVAPLIADMRGLMRCGVLAWNFSNQTFIQICPLSMVGNGGAGIYGFSADTGTPVTSANNGNGSSYWCYQNQVVSIPAIQPFGIQVKWGNAGGTTVTLTNETQLRIHLFNEARNAVAIA